MTSVFPKQLIERALIIERTRIATNKNYKRKVPDELTLTAILPETNLNCPCVFTFGNYDLGVNGEISYELCKNQRLRKILVWVNKNIVRKANSTSYQTKDVRVRVATCMLNKLVEQGYLTQELNIHIHDNLVQNTFQLWKELAETDLPF